MEPSITYLENLSSIVDAIPQDTIVSRTFIRSPEIKAILFGFAPGQELSEHTASVPAILHFIEGEADLTLGGEYLQAKPGTWAYMPAQTIHSITARTPVKMLLLMLTRSESAS